VCCGDEELIKVGIHQRFFVPATARRATALKIFRAGRAAATTVRAVAAATV
jgi:hypothetical protein